MQLCTCFLVFEIFALSNSLSPIKKRINGRRFNLALEPVIIDSNEVTKNLNNRHDFIATATDVAPKVELFTEFILETIEILNSYEDTTFEDFFHIFDFEIRKYHYGGCKFFELMQNHNTRTLLVKTLKKIRENSIMFTKVKLNEIADILRDKIYSKNVKELLDYVNSLYRNNELEFQTVINNLKQYTTLKHETHKDLEHVIRDGVRTILFNHYTELDTHIRRELKENIETFWENFKNSPASNAELGRSPNIAPASKLVNDNIKISKNMKSKLNEHDIVIKVDPQTKLIDQKKRTVSTVSPDEQFQDKEMEDDESSIEIGTQATDNFEEEQSSGQSFASSSNSINQSLERYKNYNTARYMTLYAEEISYKARTTKKTEIIPRLEKAMTRAPTFLRQPRNKSKYNPRAVTSNRKKKMKQQKINYDTSNPKQHISPDSSNEIENGQKLKLKRKPQAREPSDKQGHTVDIPAVLRSQYDAIIAVQLANNELLKSLKMLTPVDMDMKSNTTLYQMSAGRYKQEPTKIKIPAPFMRASEEIKPQKPNANTKSSSRYSHRKTYIYRKQPDESMRSIEPHKSNEDVLVEKVTNNNKRTHESVTLHDNTKVKSFNEFVNLKIKAIRHELTELKQVNDVVTKQANNNTEAVDVRNVTDNAEIKDEKDNKRKHIKGNVIEPLKSRKINNEVVNDEKNYSEEVNSEEVKGGHIYNPRSNTLSTVSTTNHYSPFVANVVKKDRATDIVNNATSQTTDNNVNITKTDTDELNNAVSTDSKTVQLQTGLFVTLSTIMM